MRSERVAAYLRYQDAMAAALRNYGIAIDKIGCTEAEANEAYHRCLEMREQARVECEQKFAQLSTSKS